MDPDKSDNFENKIYFNKYKPEKKIGEGSFGKIYSCVNINTNEKFAIKMELKSSGQNLLESEACILCYLKGNGIPNAKSYGFSGNYNVLVMELLGKSLEDLFQLMNTKFSLKTVCMIGIQMLDRLEFVHSKHVIHRDIKPDNFVVGLDSNSNMIYLIDFGLAKKFRSSKTLEHNPMKNNKKLTGTARYASINALKGLEQSRRDDLEAIGYVLMYFMKGVLPWQGLKVHKDEDRYKKIYEKKKATKAEDLCQGFPYEFTDYINYTRNLGYEENPDYEYLRNLMRNVLKKNGYENDSKFDWIPILSKNSKNLSSSTTLNHNNIILNNIQNNPTNIPQIGENNESLEKKNKIINTNTNIYINANTLKNNKEIQISHDANNVRITVANQENEFIGKTTNNGNFLMNPTLKQENIISSIQSNQVNKNDINSKPLQTYVNNSLAPQEKTLNGKGDAEESREKARDKKAKCCFS